jgi:hypothetical protein
MKSIKKGTIEDRHGREDAKEASCGDTDDLQAFRMMSGISRRATKRELGRLIRPRPDSRLHDGP